jgi:hypothetical protein
MYTIHTLSVGVTCKIKLIADKNGNLLPEPELKERADSA